ncbi:MAG: SRPBCC domain-containing protein [Candidatus Delongbacteria bacterium]
MEMMDKMIKKTRVVNELISEVWKKWTTHKGLKTFFGAENKIELKIGGDFEIYFIENNPYGLKGSEGCRILSFLPEKMLSFSWNAPPQFPEVRNNEYKTWVVVNFRIMPNSSTEVEIVHLGWPEGGEWDKVYDYFDKAWEFVLNSLEESCGKADKIQAASKKVVGIGGIFFKSSDPVKLKEWYHNHLGLNTDEYGTNFESRDSGKPSVKTYLQWSPFADKTKYFEPSQKEFMINYRVEDLVSLVEELKKEGVQVLDDIETYEYGKFVHIMDSEGNKVELWEPVAEEYEKIVEGATK